MTGVGEGFKSHFKTEYNNENDKTFDNNCLPAMQSDCIAGSERGYDRKDLVGTYKYNDTKEYVLNLHLHSDNTFMVSGAASDDSFRRFGNWEVKDDLVILHFDKSETDSLQVQNDLDRYVMKELEILDKNNLFWGYHLQEGYEKRVELCR